MPYPPTIPPTVCEAHAGLDTHGSGPSPRIATSTSARSSTGGSVSGSNGGGGGEVKAAPMAVGEQVTPPGVTSESAPAQA